MLITFRRGTSGRAGDIRRGYACDMLKKAAKQTPQCDPKRLTGGKKDVRNVCIHEGATPEAPAVSSLPEKCSMLSASGLGAARNCLLKSDALLVLAKGTV